MIQRVGLALVVLTCIACGRPSETPPTTAVAAAPTATVVAEPWVVVPMRPWPDGSVTPPRLPDNGGGHVFAFGGARAHYDGHTWHLARQTTWAWIEGMAHFGDDWIFVTHSGEVFRTAHDPLGDLTLVGTLGGQALAQGASTLVRLALVDAQGGLFFVDASAVTRVEGLTQPVRSVAFATAAFGARIDANGSLLRTIDGAATWSALRLPRGEHPTTLSVDPNDPTKLRAYDDANPSTFISIGASDAPTVGDDQVPEGEDAPPVPGSIVTQLQLEQDGYAFARAGQRWLSGLTRDHRWIGDNGEDGSSDAPVVVMPAAVPIRWPSPCTGYDGYSVWGAQLVAGCSDPTSARMTMFWTVAADGSVAHLADASSEPGVLFDPEGERYVTTQGCGAPLCLVGPQGPAPVRVPEGGRAAAIHGDRLVVQYPDHAVSVQLSSGVVTPMAFTNAEMEANLASDGTLWERNQLQLLVGEEQRHVGDFNDAFVIDASHIAVQQFDNIQVSSDGGATFVAVPVLDRSNHDLRPAHCGAWGCNFGDMIWARRSVADAIGAHMISAPSGS